MRTGPLTAHLQEFQAFCDHLGEEWSPTKHRAQSACIEPLAQLILRRELTGCTAHPRQIGVVQDRFDKRRRFAFADSLSSAAQVISRAQTPQQVRDGLLKVFNDQHEAVQLDGSVLPHVGVVDPLMDALVQAQPHQLHINFFGVDPAIVAKVIQRLPELKLGGNTFVVDLLENPLVVHDTDSLRRLASTDVTDLSLEFVNGHDSMLDDIVRAPHLEHLCLSTNPLSAAAWEKLQKIGAGRSYGLRGLTANEITAELHGSEDQHVAMEIAKLTSLEHLEFQNNRVSAQALHALGALPALKALSLGGNRDFGDDGVAAIMQSAYRDRLEYLDVSDCDISENAVQALVNLPALKVLDLSGNRLTHLGLCHIFLAEQLHEVRLYRTDLNHVDLTNLCLARPELVVHI